MRNLIFPYLISVLCAGALLTSSSVAANDGATVVYCGIVTANTTTSGEGSGPRTFEFQATSGAPSTGRFSVLDTIALPTIGSYICGDFNQGAPFIVLVALLRPGDPRYVAQAGATPVAGSLPSTTTAQSQTAVLGPDLVSLLVIGLAALAALSLLLARYRRLSFTTTGT